MSGPERQGDPLKAGAAQAERLHTFSHALRNKLTGLFEALKILQENGADAPPEITEFSERQYFQALREVEDLLDDFAVERGVSRMERSKVDLCAIIHDAVSLVQPRLGRKDQRVNIDVPATCALEGDGHYLLELMQALLSNASKFSPRGSAIDVSLERADGSAVITVCDRGVGLSPGDLRDVFRRFAMLGSRSTDGEAQGRGTLSRAKQWVEAHRGSIVADSAGPGSGSTFIVRLPL